MKKKISIFMSVMIMLTSVSFANARENNIDDISELSPSEYLNYINRVRTSEPKEKTIEATDNEDIISNNVIYIVMKQDFSEVDFSLTPEYFPELDLISVENLMQPEDIDSELINSDQFRNIYKLTLNSNDIDSLNQAVEILKNRNDIKNVSMYLESMENQVVFESADAISSNEMSDLYSEISADLNIANLPKAWNYCQGSKSIKVGIMDSGVDYTHPDMEDNVWVNEDEIPGDGIDNDNNGYIDDIHGWNFGENNNEVLDEVSGHGTVCASAAGAVGKNSIGVTGTSPEISIVSLKVSNKSGIPYAFSFDERMAKSISYAIDNNIPILSYSAACYNSSVYKAAIENYNGLLFVSAGNKGLNDDEVAHYPTSFGLDNVVTVTTVDKGTGKFGTWANYGPNSVDLAAPGDHMLLCKSDPNNHTNDRNDYGVTGGTSISAPFAAGIAALYEYYSPNSTPLEIKEAMVNSVTPENTLVGKTKSEGVVNAFGGLQYLYNHMDEYSKTWSFSDDENLSNLGAIKEKVFLNGLTINPGDSDKVEVTKSHKVIDGKYYSNYLALKEPGDKEKNSIKLSVMGPTDIYITGVTSESEAKLAPRILKVYDDNNSYVGEAEFALQGLTNKISYTGDEAKNLYLYTEFGRVNIYSISMVKKTVYDDVFDPIDKTWDMSDDKFNNLGNLTENVEIDGLTINAKNPSNGKDRNVEIRKHFDDDRYNISYNYELDLKGNGSIDYRSVKFKVPKDTKVYITAQSSNKTSSSNTIRKLSIMNEYGYNLVPKKVDKVENETANKYKVEGIEFGTIPTTKVFDYIGDGETICLYPISGGISIRKIQLAPLDNAPVYDTEDRYWNLESSIFDNFVSGSTVNGLTINGGLISAESPVEGPNTFKRYFAGSFGNYNGQFMSFDVLGNCWISIVAQSNSEEERTLMIVDKYGCLVDQITVNDKLGYYNIPYTGSKNKLYIWSLDSTIRVYAVAKTESGAAYSLDNSDNSVVIDNSVLSDSAIEFNENDFDIQERR